MQKKQLYLTLNRADMNRIHLSMLIFLFLNINNIYAQIDLKFIDSILLEVINTEIIFNVETKNFNLSTMDIEDDTVFYKTLLNRDYKDDKIKIFHITLKEKEAYFHDSIISTFKDTIGNKIDTTIIYNSDTRNFHNSLYRGYRLFIVEASDMRIMLSKRCSARNDCDVYFSNGLIIQDKVNGNSYFLTRNNYAQNLWYEKLGFGNYVSSETQILSIVKLNKQLYPQVMIRFLKNIPISKSVFFYEENKIYEELSLIKWYDKRYDFNSHYFSLEDLENLFLQDFYYSFYGKKRLNFHSLLEPLWLFFPLQYENYEHN